MAATEHVVGPQRNMHAISIGPDDDIEQRRRDIVAAVEAVDDGSGVILLTDMFGGTPSNLAISIMDQGREIIAGVNLPMLIKLASVRETESLEEAVATRRRAASTSTSRAGCSTSSERRARVAPRADAGGGGSDKTFRASVTIVNRRACMRAAAKFVKVAEQFVADIEVAKDDMVVCGTSIMGLMVLAAALGSQLEIRARGRGRGGAAALVGLVERGFDEN